MPGRYRHRDTGTYYPTCTDTQFPQSCANRTWTTPTTLTSTWAAGSSESMYDFVTRDYRRRVAKGEIILNYLYKREVLNESIGSSSFYLKSVADTCTSPSIKFEEVMSGKVWAWLMPQYVTPVNGTPLSSERQASVIEETYTNCMAKRGSGEANLVESLAELDQVWHMVGNPLENCVRFLRDYRRDRIKREKSFLGSTKKYREFLSSEWLRFRYGISPVISDVKAGIKVARKKYSEPPVRVTTRSTGQAQASEVTTGSFTRGSFVYGWQKTCVHRILVRAASIDQYTKGPFNDLGLTFKNVVGLPWELTKYSFVVDWFGNVGDLIYANIPSVGMDHLGAYVSHLSENITVYSPTTVTCPSGSFIVLQGPTDQIKMTDRYKARTPRADNGSFVIRDDFKFDHWKRSSDAIALIGQLLSQIHF